MFFLTRLYSSQLFLQKRMQIYIHFKWCCDPKTLSLCTIPTPDWSRIFSNWMPIFLWSGDSLVQRRQFVLTVTNRCNKIPWNASLPTMVFHVLMPLTSNKNPSFPTITWVETKTTNISILPRKNRTASLPLKAMKTKIRLSFLLNSSVFLRLWLSLAVLCITAALLGLFLPKFSMVKDSKKSQCKMGDVECDHIWQPEIMKSWCILQSLTVKGLWKDILKSSKIYYLSKIFSNLHPFFMFTCFQLYLCSDSI